MQLTMLQLPMQLTCIWLVSPTLKSPLIWESFPPIFLVRSHLPWFTLEKYTMTWENYLPLRQAVQMVSPPKLLKEFAYELSSPVTDIINASLSQCKVPTQWKEANVIPIPKHTPPSIDKLRPVSLTCTLAKVAESRVCKWISNHIQHRIDNRQLW